MYALSADVTELSRRVSAGENGGSRALKSWQTRSYIFWRWYFWKSYGSYGTELVEIPSQFAQRAKPNDYIGQVLTNIDFGTIVSNERFLTDAFDARELRKLSSFPAAQCVLVRKWAYEHNIWDKIHRNGANSMFLLFKSRRSDATKTTCLCMSQFMDGRFAPSPLKISHHF